MPKVKVVKRFNDMAEKKGAKNTIREVDDVLDVSERRAEHLMKQKMVVMVEESEQKGESDEK